MVPSKKKKKKKKKKKLLNFAANFLHFFAFFKAFQHKNVENAYFDQRLECAHPNAGQNIKHRLIPSS